MLHTTPYSESSVVVKVFTRQLGVRSYIIKGVRGRGGRIKQNLLQPLSCLDMVVYNNEKTDLNYVKEVTKYQSDQVSESLDHSATQPLSHSATQNALRFFMTEVLYKALREAEPMPALFDYVESINSQFSILNSQLPITFLLTVARHLGIEPLDNHSSREPLFDLQEGRFVSAPSETTLSPSLSESLHQYLSTTQTLSDSVTQPLKSRRDLIDALITYYHLHLSGFAHFHSHEILHTILK